MISLERPELLGLLALWVPLVWMWVRSQTRAWAWVTARVDPRFRRRLTVHGRGSLRFHLLMLALGGLLLVIAVAGLVQRGEGETEVAGTPVLFLLDASASSYASDIEGSWFGAEVEVPNRFSAIQQFALHLVDELGERPLALASFSGVATLHLPPIADVDLFRAGLRAAEPHGFYQRTGSSLQAALELVVELAVEEPSFQVVLLGDGELPKPEIWQEALDTLVEMRIPVHALTVGSEEGQGRLIYDFRDREKPAEEKRVLLDYSTRRVDEHFERIAEETDGSFNVLEPEGAFLVLDRLKRAIEAGDGRPRVTVHDRAVTDLVPWLLLAVLAVVLLDGLYGRPRVPPAVFRLEALGTPPERTGQVRSSNSMGPSLTIRSSLASLVLLLALTLLACGRTALEKAHLANERGIARDAKGDHVSAGSDYRRSAALGVRPWIPTYNAARSSHLAGRYGEAHELYQKALTMEPSLDEAIFNHGVVLWDWGEAMRDPEGCALERTQDLWQQAARRFASLEARDDDLGIRSAWNRDHVETALLDVARLVANPPEGCPACENASEDQSENEGEGGGGEGGGEQDESGGGGGGGSNDDQDESSSGGGGAGGEEGGGGASGNGNEPSGSGEPPPGGQGSGEPPSGEGPSGSGQDQGEGRPEDGDGGGGGGASGESEDGQGGGGGLTDEEREQIEALLGEIRGRGEGEGKYHRRTIPEQFGEDHWGHPDPELWW